MLILALDSTAAISTAALCEDDKKLAEYCLDTGNTHSETLLPMIESMLKTTGRTIDDIDLFAFTAGPGSFTGVRIGAATVKGLAFGRNKPCVGVSAPEALAYNLREFNGLICPVINARRSQVYNALFKAEDGKLTRLCPDRIITTKELDTELSQINDNIMLCGDAYEMTLKDMESTQKIIPTPSALRDICGYSVALCAKDYYQAGNFTTDSQLLPDYLRPSQAERERLENQSNLNKIQ